MNEKTPFHPFDLPSSPYNDLLKEHTILQLYHDAFVVGNQLDCLCLRIRDLEKECEALRNMAAGKGRRGLHNIVAAANKLTFEDGTSTVVCGVRHWDMLMHGAVNRFGDAPVIVSEVQGFVDNTGTFLSREEAREVAIAAGQVDVDKISRKLFSEDLW